MIEQIAKSKRNELIISLQGTPKHPKIKFIREKLLNINTSIELAEILDVTRPTISKLEKCTNKLSGAQYLAICSLIEKEKNNMLQKLDNNWTDKKEAKNALDKLFIMSVFYKKEFLFNLIKLLFDKMLNKDSTYKLTIDTLRKITSLDNWIDTRNLNEEISTDEEEFINSDIYIDISSFNNIRDLTIILEKQSSPNNISKGKLYFIYKDVLDLLDDIERKLESNCDSSSKEEMVKFIVKFSLLLKSNKAVLVNYDKVTGSIAANRSQASTDLLFTDDSIKMPPAIIVVQDEKLAEKIKFDTLYVRKIKNEFDVFLELTYRATVKNMEICKFENNVFKRWIFDYENVLEKFQNLTDDEKKEFEERRITEFNFTSDSPDEIKSKLDTYVEENTKITSEMLLAINEKLETVNRLILKYITPNDNVI